MKVECYFQPYLSLVLSLAAAAIVTIHLSSIITAIFKCGNLHELEIYPCCFSMEVRKTAVGQPNLNADEKIEYLSNCVLDCYSLCKPCHFA